ncbi:thioesterase family protein [Kutzneria sp. NPDC052558]|uniref:thioesterase family protein n=1 Tax=Kutzneria sp. NPDC052558 TaxID=3364121 RepID=UPI0037CB3705
MGDFADATELSPRADGGFDVDLHPKWALEDKPNGGYLLAVLARAAGTLSSHPHLTALSGSFVQSPKPGPAVVTAEVLRAGRGATQLRARLSQGDRPCVEALATFGQLDEAEPWWSGTVPVALPPIEDCPRSGVVGPGGAFRIHILDVVEQRLDPSTSGFLRGEPTGRGLIAGWLRLADGTDWDPVSLMVAVDAMPPIGYDLSAPGWTPTVQLSAYVRRLPAAGPVRIRVTCTDVGAGQIDHAVHVWDSKDRLVAQATQICALRLP